MRGIGNIQQDNSAQWVMLCVVQFGMRNGEQYMEWTINYGYVNGERQQWMRRKGRATTTKTNGEWCVFRHV